MLRPLHRAEIGKSSARFVISCCSRSSIALLGILLGTRLALADAEPEERAESGGATSPAYCIGDYTDDFAVLSAKARDTERQQAAYTFCVRTTATYSCPFYGRDGELQSRNKQVVAHGTAFAYEVHGKDTLLLTNQHVSDWPLVTNEQHAVEDVPSGCKRVSESLAIVDNEADAFEGDDLSLSRVVSDPQLDVAVLRAQVPLPVMPWRVGHSAGLHARNVVQVRGFPLGIFKATNVGKVVSAYDHDSYGAWDHDDFVIDALLSSGNSGSPVLAISCRTGEFELVGIFHAGYSRGSALNVVIGIDQVHDLMTTLQRKPHAATEILANEGFDASLVEAEVRREVVGGFLFPFGSRVGGVWIRSDDTLIFDVLGRKFPFETHPVFAAESLPGADPRAPFNRVWFGKAAGLGPYQVSELDAETQAQLAKIGRALRLDSYLTARYRAADRDVASRQASEDVARIERSLEGALSSQKELVRVLSDLADRLGPSAGTATVSLADVLAPPAPANGAAIAPSLAATSGFAVGGPAVGGASRPSGNEAATGSNAIASSGTGVPGKPPSAEPAAHSAP
jgi:hypothetical protein